MSSNVENTVAEILEDFSKCDRTGRRNAVADTKDEPLLNADVETSLKNLSVSGDKTQGTSTTNSSTKSS